MKSLSQYPNLNEYIISELDELFGSCPPLKLKKSMQNLLFQYCKGTYSMEAEEFRSTLADICRLLEFLEKVE